MKEKLIYVLDIGSSKISLLACIKDKFGYKLLTSENCLYDGFMDGMFFTPENIPSVLGELINKMNSRLRTTTSTIYVGVPSEFCVCVCKRISRTYLEPRKITQKDIQELFSGVDTFSNTDDNELMSFSPMQYQLDGGIKTINPIGMKTCSIVVDCSYLLVKRSVIKLISPILSELGFANINYISSALGQALLCGKSCDADTQIAVVDVGHITTSVAILKGEGLSMLSSFSLGGGHITADLMELLSKPFDEAEILKRKVRLTVQPRKDEKYIINDNGKEISSVIYMTNDIVRSRIENIASVIDNVLSIDEMFKDIPIYLTGDGMANFKGAKNILEDITKRRVYEFKLPFNNTNGKFQTSKMGLVELINRLV